MRELTNEELLLVNGGNGYSIFDYVGYGPADSYMTAAELAAALGNATMAGGRADIERFFGVGTEGMHIGMWPGSVLSWQTLQVNWSLYGNSSMTPDQILYNAYMHGATGTNPYSGGGSGGGGGGGNSQQ